MPPQRSPLIHPVWPQSRHAGPRSPTLTPSSPAWPHPCSLLPDCPSAGSCASTFNFLGISGVPLDMTFGPWVPPTQQHCRNPRGLQRQPFLHPNGPLASGRAALSPMSTEARPGFSLDFISLRSCNCLRMPSQHSLQPCHSSWREFWCLSLLMSVMGSAVRVQALVCYLPELLPLLLDTGEAWQKLWVEEAL